MWSCCSSVCFKHSYHVCDSLLSLLFLEGSGSVTITLVNKNNTSNTFLLLNRHCYYERNMSVQAVHFLFKHITPPNYNQRAPSWQNEITPIIINDAEYSESNLPLLCHDTPLASRVGVCQHYLCCALANPRMHRCKINTVLIAKMNYIVWYKKLSMYGFQEVI